MLWKALGTRRGGPASSRRRRGRPVVPVFWVASDDHDFAEIRSTTVIDAGGSAAHAALRPARRAGRTARLGRSRSTRRSAASSTSSARALPAALGRDETLEVVAACYRAGETLSSGLRAARVAAAARARRARSRRRRAEAAGGPGARARAARGLADARSLALEAGQALLAAGYHQQVPVRPGFLNLFAVVDGQRRALAIANGTVEVRGTRERWPIAEAAAAASRATRARGARARSCARWCRTPCCRPPPTSAARPRSRTTRRSDRPTRTSASRARCCCRGRA